MNLLRIFLFCFIFSTFPADAKKREVPQKPVCKEFAGWETDGACQRSKIEDVGTLIAQECIHEKAHLRCTIITTLRSGGIYEFTLSEKVDWSVGQKVQFSTIVLSPAHGEKTVTAICGPSYAFCVLASMKILASPTK